MHTIICVTCNAVVMQAALDILTGMLPWSGLPSVPVLDKFVKCLCSLFELLVSGVADKIPVNGRY